MYLRGESNRRLEKNSIMRSFIILNPRDIVMVIK
jgi:hypothetical protein